MCVLSDKSLNEIYTQLFPRTQDHDRSLINPASIDIRIGETLQFEDESIYDLKRNSPYILSPHEFVLVAVYEHIYVPPQYAVELKLKSSRAREGFNHSLAFWVDPGWDGILTMEVMNVNNYSDLKLDYGMKFAQIIVHKLDQPATPYTGRYQHATSVEVSKI